METWASLFTCKDICPSLNSHLNLHGNKSARVRLISLVFFTDTWYFLWKYRELFLLIKATLWQSWINSIVWDSKKEFLYFERRYKVKLDFRVIQRKNIPTRKNKSEKFLILKTYNFSFTSYTLILKLGNIKKHIIR